MTKDEALKQAMEAMEITGGFDIEINAIKEALAQPEPLPWINKMSIDVPNQPLYTAPPEPWEKFCDSNCVWTDHHPDCKLAEQKPVVAGWLRIVQGHTGFVAAETEWGAKKPEKAGMWIPLYTSPPQHKPLTDDEIDELRSGYQSGRIGSFVSLARAIESAVWEKQK